MYLVLKRFFFLRTFGQHSTSLTIRHRHVEKNYPLSICKEVLFHRPRKEHPAIKTVLENLSRYLWYENQQLLPEILGGTNDRIKNYKKFSLWQPSLFTLLRVVRRLNTKDSNSQSDKSLLCSSLNENSFRKTEKENLLLYSLTVNGN